MSLFLNTEKLNYWLPKLFKEAEKELVIIVPYIQTSEKIFKALQNADKRGVEITLIYRENKLTDTEKNKLLSLHNINLLHHPNIHCKCYYNGDLLIMSSMNLYEYSEKNNREMGVLFSRNGLDLNNTPSYIMSTTSDSKELFDDAIIEIKEIINGARLERISDKAKESSFEIDIIKTDEELEYERCNKINKYFLNKKFKPYEYSDNRFYSRCDNFFDKVEVTFQGHRASVNFKLSENELKKLHKNWKIEYDEYEFSWFKYYWNYHTQDILIYKDTNFNWDELTDDEEYYNKLQTGINNIIIKYRRLTGK